MTACPYCKKAREHAKHSPCPDKKAQITGAVLQKGTRVIGMGYPICRTLCDNAKHYNIDAEIVALVDALQNGFDPQGATLHLTGHWGSCQTCTIILSRCGVISFCIDPETARTNPQCHHKPPS